MKVHEFSLTTISLVAIVILMVVSVVFLLKYYNSQGTQTILASERVAARDSLDRFDEFTSLQEKLSIAEAELAIRQNAFPSQVKGPETINTVIRLAEESGLTVSVISSVPRKNEQIDDHTYSELSMQIQVVGTLGALRNLISELESGAIKASRLDKLSITGIEELSQENRGFGSPERASADSRYRLIASIDISMFARTGQ